MRNRFCKIQAQAIAVAEDIYDQVIRRWGNIKFAQSTVYDWVWSEEFKILCSPLTELETGTIRVYVMRLFSVKPWPWYSPSEMRISNEVSSITF